MLSKLEGRTKQISGYDGDAKGLARKCVGGRGGEIEVGDSREMVNVSEIQVGRGIESTRERDQMQSQ